MTSAVAVLPERCPHCREKINPECVGTWRGVDLCGFCADDLRQLDIDALTREHRARETYRLTREP